MWARLRSWLDGSFRRKDVERDLADEMTFHLRSRTDHWVAQGLTPADAARRAQLEFGSVERYKEDSRHARGLRSIDELRADLRYGLRQMRSVPGFTLVTVAILAIAIGANTAVFSILDAVLFRMLPVDRPHELRELAWVEGGNPKWKISYDGSMRPYEGGRRIAWSFAYPIYTHIRDRSTTFADLFLFTQQDVTAGVGGRQERVSTLLVSGNFAGGLGLRMSIGRPIMPDDDRAGAPAVAVLTYAAWQRLFNADPGVLGRTLNLNGSPAVIVGVTAPSFFGVEPGWPIEVMAPIASMIPILEPGRDVLGNAKYWAFRMMGRVRPAVADARVQVETEALLRQALPSDLVASNPDELPRVIVSAGGQGLDSLRRNYSRPLYLLLGILAVALLIGCANIAGLLLTRNAARQREFAVRLALGAGRGRLVRQLLTESVLLAAAGGAVGLGLALLVRDQLLPVLNQEDAPIVLALGYGPALWGFAAALCVVVGLLVGMLPALRTTRLGASRALVRAMPGSAAAPSRLFAGKTLIALQVALSLVLVVGAGLFLRTLLNLRSEPLGFRPDHVLLFRVDGPASGYSGTRLLDFYERALERIKGIPGVTAASFARYGLLSGGATTDGIVVAGDKIGVHLHFIAPGYFETMGIPLAAGRDVAAADRESTPRVAIVNQALARLLPGGGPGLGQPITHGNRSGIEVVGVVGDARFASLREPAPPTLYLPYRQSSQNRMTFAVRTAADPGSLAASVRRAMEETDPNVPLFEMRTQDAQIDLAVRQERVFAYVASGFALLALVLACLGIYGTLGVLGRAAHSGDRAAHGARRRSRHGRPHGAERVDRPRARRRGVRARCRPDDHATHRKHPVRAHAA